MQHIQKLVFTLVLLKISPPARAIEKVYGAEGGDVVLKSPNGPPRISRIEWKHGADIAAEWYGNKTNCLTKFEGRCKLHNLTGALTITGLTKTDSGIYKPEINYVVFDSTELIVISHVPKPLVSESCDTDMTACNLTCEGNTTGAEPVTCKWFLGDTEGPSGKVYTITKEMKEQSFSCMLANPVGFKSSDSMKNPLLIEKDNLVQIIVPVVVVLLALVIIGVIVFRIRKRRTGSFNTGEQNRGTKQSVKYDPAATEEEANHEAGNVQRLLYRDLNAKDEVNHVAEVHVPPTQESKSLSNGSAVNPEVQEASNQASDSTPLQKGCNGAVKAAEISSNNDLTSSASPEAGKEAENTSVVVEMSDQNPTIPASPASSQETAVNPEVQEASNQASDSTPLQNGCNGAVRAAEISSNNDLTSSASPEAGKEADITLEVGQAAPQDPISPGSPETEEKAENTSVVVEMSDQNPTIPASPASSQETDELAVTPADQQETPADEQEADDAGDLDEH